MKTYNKLMLALLGSTLVVGTGSAQTWTVNGNTQSTPLTTNANEAAVAIDPLSGIASVRTPGAGPSVSISANPTSVNVGVNTSISWTASGFGNNLNCTRSSSPALSGWSGPSSGATGSVSVTMPATAQTVTITLSCSGDSGSAANSTNVNVIQSGSSVDCSQRPPSYNGTPRTLVNRSYFEAWDLPFPGAIGQGAFNGGGTGILHGTVSAFQFVAPSSATVPFDGYLISVYSPEHGGRGTIVAGFSECPGEINNQTPNCAGDISKPRSDWTVRVPPTANFCAFVPGRTYYYNINIVKQKWVYLYLNVALQEKAILDVLMTQREL